MSIIKRIVKRIISANKIVKLNITYCAPNETLKGHKALITGGSSGIGLAIAKRFLSEGAEVIICARNESNLTAVCQELNISKLHTLVLDIADIPSLEGKIAKADKILSGIDIFVNAAGVSAFDEDAMTEKMYDYICDINQKGLFFMNKLEGDYMIAHNIQGKIINITSKAGERIGFDPYILSKWGANSITKGNARRLAPYHINVNGIAPGRVPTNITKELQSHKNTGNAFTAAHSTERFTQPEEVAATALFLASGETNNIVGQIIVMDGGSYN